MRIIVQVLDSREEETPSPPRSCAAPEIVGCAISGRNFGRAILPHFGTLVRYSMSRFRIRPPVQGRSAAAPGRLVLHDLRLDQRFEHAPHPLAIPLTLALAGKPSARHMIDDFLHLPFAPRECCQ